MDEQHFRALVREVVESGRPLDKSEAHAALTVLLRAPEPPPESLALPLAALLGALAHRGETAGELAGFAEAMRAAALPIPLTDDERARLVDTCGTGGDGLDTFNISTAAALVAAGAGAWVAKHGNRAITSRCGSADVLEALGVPIALGPEQAAECLRSTSFAFLLAPIFQPAMRRVAPVRRALPFRTIFNLAGPLTNPAGAAAQVIGVPSENKIGVVAEALRLLNARHAWVVHGRVEGAPTGLDELTTTGQSLWAAVEASETRTGVLWPETYGFPLTPLTALEGGGTAEKNASIIERILNGEDEGPRRHIVLLNAAAALLVSGLAPTLPEALDRATEAVDSGKARQVLTRLRAFAAAHPALS